MDNGVVRPCCDSRKCSVEVVTVALTNLMVHRVWERSAQSRWTYLLNMLKRAAFGFAAGRILPRALSDMQICWKVDQSMTTLLEKLVEADVGNYIARNRLRLLRVTSTMCSQKFGWQLALEITALNMVDPLLYEILGDGEKLRVGLLDMVNPETSPVCVRKAFA